MPKLRFDDDELNIKELEEAEYKEGSGSFTSYEGPIPPAKTILWAYVKKIWVTYSAEKDDGTGGDPMLKVLTEATDNPGEKAEYDGLPVWENMVLTAKGKWKWAPFLDHFGLTIRDIKTKTIVAPEPEDNGDLVEKIAGWEPGSDEAYCRIVTTRETYNGSKQAHVGTWLDWTEPEEPEDPTDEDEEPEEPARPSRSRASAKKTPARRRAEPEEDEEEKPRASARTGRAKAGAASGATRGRGRRAGGAKGGEADDDPPF